MGSLTLERLGGTIEADSEKAFHIAEAGLEYYRWHFAEFPGDLQDGTASAGPYEHDVADPETSNTIGTFSLDISGITSCGVLTSATVNSTGSMASSSTHRTTLIAEYGKPTLSASTSPAKSDATAIATSLPSLKTYAQSSGVYIATSTGYGYKIVFKSNGTFDASPVTGVTEVWGYSTDDGWQQEDTIISTTGVAVNHTVPSECPVVFVEDTVWLQGTVSGKVTLVSANITNAGVDPNIVLTGNITYAHAYDDGFTAIAEDSVLISLDSPDVMQLSGIYVASKGHFGRHRYDASGTHAVPVSLQSSVLRSTLNTFGTFASMETVDTKWLSSGAFISGYSTRTDVHDPFLGKLPPPFTPVTSNDFRFTDWRIQE
ncbi:MAG: hypothetical protein V4449_00985 [Patescibacteria group bacterium]